MERTRYGADAPDGKAVRALGGRVHVTDTRAAGRETRAPDEACEEAKGEEHAEIRRERRGHLQDHKEQQREDVNRIPPRLRDLGQRAPDHGAQAVAGDEDGQAERRGHRGHAKVRGRVRDARRVDGRADVDAKGQEADLEGDEELFAAGPIHGVLCVVSARIMAWLE